MTLLHIRLGTGFLNISIWRSAHGKNRMNCRAKVGHHWHFGRFMLKVMT